ncbi:MAG: diadenylate cyclase [Vulcanimicrobiaceae bacterium]
MSFAVPDGSRPSGAIPFLGSGQSYLEAGYMAASVLRKNSKLRDVFNAGGILFLEHACGSVERLLPHVQVSAWTEVDYAEASCVRDSTASTAFRVIIPIETGDKGTRKSLAARVERRSVPGNAGTGNRTLDEREHQICKLIVERAAIVLGSECSVGSDASVRAITAAFDEYVVANYVESYHDLQMPVSSVFEALRTLSEQTYENHALTFGCILDPTKTVAGSGQQFPGPYLRAKKYKALSDGFRTAYHISSAGHVIGFVDLDRFEKASTGRHYYPDWSEPIARASHSERCSIALSRQGDILVFDAGSLRFTYRYGRWQYWNHSHLINLLRDRARAQRVPQKILANVVGAIYRIALDVSFRRSGALFVILHNRNNIRDIVKSGDAIGDRGRRPADVEFDGVIAEHKIQGLPRAVAVEIASLDGAVVFENSGVIRAYGAVLQPRKKGRLRGTEGSRTKAAIGASHCGHLAIKVSSDGDITVYHAGEEFIRMGGSP